MKTMKALFICCSILAVVGIITGHPWHIGTLVICLTMVAVTTEDEDKITGRR